MQHNTFVNGKASYLYLSFWLLQDHVHLGMSTTEDIRIGGKSYEPIKDTAKRYDKDKDKPVVTTNLVDKQKRKLDNLMARIDKPINIKKT